MAKGLTPKQAKFVAEYVKCGEAKRAALAAGYKDGSAIRSQASEMLQVPKIKAEIEKRMAKLTNKLEITAERVLKERARLAFFDPRCLFRDDGTPKEITELDDDTAAAVAGLDVEALFDGGGKDAKRIGSVKKYKLADKNASLTALEKHLGLYKDDSSDNVPLHIHLHL